MNSCKMVVDRGKQKRQQEKSVTRYILKNAKCSSYIEACGENVITILADKMTAHRQSPLSCAVSATACGPANGPYRADNDAASAMSVKLRDPHQF